MMIKKLPLLILLLPHLLFAQSKRSRYKYELIGGIGVANFMGDLGGANQIGTHLLKDFEYKATRPNIVVGARYKKNYFFSFKSTLTYAMLSGKDSWTDEKYRNNRNLSFRSPIIELNAQVEYYLLREKMSGIYKISNFKKKRNRRSTLFMFTGVGVFFYNPRAEYNGKWYSLRKLHTEGQGLPGGPKKYSNFNICIPVGLGYKYTVDRRWSIGIDLGFRKTFTDYIDDVSGEYYDNNAIKQAYGTTAAALADPSLGLIPGATKPNADGSGAKRGETKYKDAYMFLDFSVSYKFTKKRRTRSKF
ncbi:MAG: DUF6089 family protein [Bacteroidota bacterium]|nr:DUF6089 family protein [Bacteroidota bacterium]